MRRAAKPGHVVERIQGTWAPAVRLVGVRCSEGEEREFRGGEPLHAACSGRAEGSGIGWWCSHNLLSYDDSLEGDKIPVEVH